MNFACTYFVIYLTKDMRRVETQETERERERKREEKHPKMPEHEIVKYFEWLCRRAFASSLPVRKKKREKNKLDRSARGKKSQMAKSEKRRR